MSNVATDADAQASAPSHVSSANVAFVPQQQGDTVSLDDAGVARDDASSASADGSAPAAVSPHAHATDASGIETPLQSRSEPLSPILDASPTSSQVQHGAAQHVDQAGSHSDVTTPTSLPPLKPTWSSASRPTHTPRSPSSPPLTSPGQRGFGLASTSSTASPFASASASGTPPTSCSRTRTRPASALVGSLSQAGASLQGLPKPRSNSSLQSSRPAPPSPATSRPPSQVLTFSPGQEIQQLSPRSPGATSPPPSSATPVPGVRGSSPIQCGGRDRAPSMGSAGRRLRPKSTLGTSMVSGALFQDAIASEPSSPEHKGKDSGSLAPAQAVDGRPESRTTRSAKNAVLDDTASAVTILARVRRVVVRDYAFPMGDNRFDGLGPTRPYSNWGEGEPEPEKPKQPQPTGWGGLSLSLGSWNFMRRGNDTEQHTEGPVEDLGTDHDNDDYWSDDQDDDDDADDDDYYDDDQEPDGLFRAAYAFDPEGVNEMAIAVGDLLDVRGRGGGGDGWVVAIRLDTGEEGLVPEGYLERAAEKDYPDAWDNVRTVREAMSVAPPGESSSSQPLRGNVLAQPVCATPSGVSPESV